jgi:hypothetical protein
MPQRKNRLTISAAAKTWRLSSPVCAVICGPSAYSPAAIRDRRNDESTDSRCSNHRDLTHLSVFSRLSLAAEAMTRKV